ncbi:hypothetical protein [Abyssisolibacter fermentans]|uniref:hypothetical protein n=1 Tax=Abyssisolibacter fermentans TaxID=1766203 RepID=UPI00082DD41E|nr:hypothetical protein [Abyssisolibacter fermentans]
MRKTMISIVILMSVFIIGCSNTNDKIGKSIKCVEILDNRFSNFQISYNDYMKEIIDIFSSRYFTEADHIKRNHGHAPDMNKEIYTECYKLADKDVIRYDCEIQISKVYDLKDDTKVVFTKTKLVYKDKKLGIDYITKKYYLINEDNSWKIIGRDGKVYSEYANKFKKTSKTLFETFNNKPIEYIQTVNPFSE